MEGRGLQQALAEITAPKSTNVNAENHRLYSYLVDGNRLSYIDTDGTEVNPSVRLISAEPFQRSISIGSFPESLRRSSHSKAA